MLRSHWSWCLGAILIFLAVCIFYDHSLHAEWQGLKPQGWDPEVREQLENHIRAKAGSHLPVVFDLDETILARDIADAVFAVLVRDGIISKATIPSHLTPSFRLGGKIVSIEQARDLIEYGQWMLQSTVHQADDPSPNICFYTWVAQLFDGLTCEQVVKATAKAYQKGIAINDFAQFPYETKIEIHPKESCLVPFIRPEMADLIAAFLLNDYDVWVISASPVLVARWVVLTELNALIAAQGIPCRMSPDHVIGISTMLQDDQGTFFKDYPLVCTDQGYAQLDLDALSRYRMTSLLTPPVTGYSGKVAAIVERIGTFPYFGAGDSLNDMPFLKLCTHKLWMARLESPALQMKATVKIKEDLESWLIQPVLSKKAPCLVSEASLLPNFLDGDDLTAAARSFEIILGLQESRALIIH